MNRRNVSPTLIDTSSAILTRARSAATCRCGGCIGEIEPGEPVILVRSLAIVVHEVCWPAAREHGAWADLPAPASCTTCGVRIRYGESALVRENWPAQCSLCGYEAIRARERAA